MTEIDQDIRNWNADMDAWGLTDRQRVHHLRRLHQHHLRLMYLHLDKAERLNRVQVALMVLLVISLLIGALL